MTDANILKVELYAEAEIPTEFGNFLVSVYHNNKNDDETLLVSLNLDSDETPFVRIHSECFTGEVLSSLKCDCKAQLALALDLIQKRGSGAVVYLRQEGRGIGLGNKIKAYALQNKGHDTIEANHILGFETDLRDFEEAAVILKDRNISKLILNTNNPDKISSLKDFGIEVVSVEPSITEVNEHNEKYFETKMNELGHLLKKLF